MKALFIGGTGIISMAITRRFLAEGNTLYLLNRGNRKVSLEGDVHYLIADINNEEDKVRELIKDMSFDVVADFIVFTEEQAARDVRLFSGKTKQYITFSSASAYQKPLSHFLITESTPIANPYWLYSRNKIKVENYLNQAYRDKGFPVTIIRPSHTYDERYVPLAVEGRKGAYQVLKRIREGKPVLVHGDGLSLWTVTHNSDFAKGFVGLMGNLHAIGETFHITSDESVTWNQIYGIIADALGTTAKLVHVSSEFLDAVSESDFMGGLIGDKANSVVFDNSKIKRYVPGFVCTKRADQGIRETVLNVMNTPELQIEDPEFDAWCDRVIAALEHAKKEIRGEE